MVNPEHTVPLASPQPVMTRVMDENLRSSPPRVPDGGAAWKEEDPFFAQLESLIEEAVFGTECTLHLNPFRSNVEPHSPWATPATATPAR
mmetsp:Transcript_15459/g.27385  ORF Transcript_15459/g.27385 Transcript_15459/m.27385 type:complete len:90 (+) Transcript_15459:112-381(+)